MCEKITEKQKATCGTVTVSEECVNWPYSVKRNDNHDIWQVIHECHAVASFWFDSMVMGFYEEDEARQSAEAEALRLNARFRDYIKQRRITAFIGREKQWGGRGPWEEIKQFVKDGLVNWCLNDDGLLLHGWLGDVKTASFVTQDELEEALRAAGIPEPLTEEQERAIRARVELSRKYARGGDKHDMLRRGERKCPVVYLDPDSGFNWNDTPHKNCTVRVTQEQITAWEKANPEPVEPVESTDKNNTELQEFTEKVGETISMLARHTGKTARFAKLLESDIRRIVREEIRSMRMEVEERPRITFKDERIVLAPNIRFSWPDESPVYGPKPSTINDAEKAIRENPLEGSND